LNEGYAIEVLEAVDEVTVEVGVETDDVDLDATEAQRLDVESFV
jgi:hypothetical protein